MFNSVEAMKLKNAIASYCKYKKRAQQNDLLKLVQ